MMPMCFDPLTFIEEAEREINVKDICGSLTEFPVNDKIIQTTENEFVIYQSAIINHMDSVTIEEARECAGEVQEESNSTVRRSRQARKRTHDAFMYYDDRLGGLRSCLRLVSTYMKHSYLCLECCFFCLVLIFKGN